MGLGLKVETGAERTTIIVDNIIFDLIQQVRDTGFSPESRRRAVEDQEASQVGMIPTCDVRSAAPRYSSCTNTNKPRSTETKERRRIWWITNDTYVCYASNKPR